MKLSFQNYRSIVLPFVVFVTGACVLIIEIVATRVLAPYFGTTIYAVSSVIGVVLGALSLGYYFGGRFADRHCERAFFYFIIFCGGLSVFFLELLILSILPALGQGLSIVSGPLVASMLLFFLPGVLLGMLSPFAVALQKKICAHEGVGSVSGDIFFWSTLGSIAGSIMAGFVLIPLFGIHHIIISVAVALCALGALGVSFSVPKKKRMYCFVVIGVIIFVGAVFFFFAEKKTQAGVLYMHDGVYEQLMVFEKEYNGRPTRFLQQDRSSSAAMFLDSDDLVYDYTKYFVVPALIKPDAHRVLTLGAGAYSIPKAYLARFPKSVVDVVDIEPELYELAKKYFHVPDTDRLKNYVADGRRFLAGKEKTYDVLFSDVYASLYSIPSHFTTREFFQESRRVLTDNGVFIGNFIGSLSREHPSLLFSEMRTFQDVFPNSYFFAVQSPGSLGVQNIIFVGINGDATIDMSSDSATKNTDPIIRTLSERIIDPRRFALKEYSEFTDAYAPVEYATAPLFREGKSPALFDARNAYQLIAQQLTYGNRSIAGNGHTRMQDFLKAETSAISKKTINQEWDHAYVDGGSVHLSNIGMSLFPEKKKRIILATHYDTQHPAFKDAEHPDGVDPGANNGASGVAVLLELARALVTAKESPVGVDIVFFDGEEGERGVGKGDWSPLGSRYFAQHITDIYPESKPIAGIVIDMVCDKDFTLKKEPHSARAALQLVDDVWRAGRRVAPSVFSDEKSVGIDDDHTSLNAIGIPSALLIDFDYPPNYTTHDTIDKCSTKSLQSIGDTLLEYIRSL
ncbi:MAG: fused MFS/spermidine synthase [Candidatus Uhrbacteria bacterium]|nr:fused MFS/spermidine synthase [Candidatus Uhrbacteria bacterium]